jgi:ketosteroid isomerase-like protein
MLAMKTTEIRGFINAWIAAGNQFDTKKYVRFFLPNAILDDPSVGKKFNGHTGIREYFDSYFIGYNTQTRLVKLHIIDDHHTQLEVHFTGDFPGGKIGGTFDITFEEDKIAFIKADLLHSPQ